MPVLFTWVGFFVVRIPLAYLLAPETISLGEYGAVAAAGIGLLGAWYAMFADLVIRGLFFFWRFARGAWKRQKV